MKKTKINTTLIYPTHLLSHQWEDCEELNKNLREMILEKEKTTKGITKSNAGGFHSDWDLLIWEDEPINEFTEMIQYMIEEMVTVAEISTKIDISITAWANVMRSGNYHITHKHPNNTWSGCYYVSSGKIDTNIENNGRLEFVDPRPGNNMITLDALPSARYQISTKEGLMVMFPSYLDHFVHSFVGNGERISIAFNVRLI